MDTVREMKEKLCFVSYDPKREHKLAQVGDSHMLPATSSNAFQSLVS